MNIHKTIAIVSVVFTILFSMAPVMGAVTIVNPSEFDTAKSGAEWSGGIVMATNNGREMGLSGSGTFSHTVDYEFWKHTNDPFLEEDVVAFVTVVSSGSNITMTMSQVSGPFPSGASVGTVSASYAPTSALWIGIRGSNTSTSPNFDMFLMQSNGQSIPGSINVSGTGFAGFKIATDNTIDFSGWIRTSQNSAPSPYVGNDARFTVFGDNSLDAIPEPSIPTLVGMIGIFFLLRKRR